jgi:hypothetical protein
MPDRTPWRIPRVRAALAALALFTLALFLASADALVVRSGDLILHTDGGASPTSLPRTHNAPISLHGFGRFSTASGALPPALQTLALEFDRHSSIETEGLPTCTRGRLAATKPVEARRICPGAIVGTGTGTAVIAFPESTPLKMSSPITFFNGPPSHGNPTLISHAYLSSPISTTYLARLVIETVHHGPYGYRVMARFPPIANGYGIPIRGTLRFGRRWTYRGARHSYLNARCQNGSLQARGAFTFADGNALRGVFVKPCSVRP